MTSFSPTTETAGSLWPATGSHSFVTGTGESGRTASCSWSRAGPEKAIGRGSFMTATVQLLGPSSIRVRTYERGVEGETLACGTGVSAAALIAARINRFESPIAVEVLSGDLLEVAFEEEKGGFRNVRLTGPADFVFEGE